jgi:adenosylcobyric acid synthase
VALDIPLRSQDKTLLDIAVIQVPHSSNFDDFDPLARENGVALHYVNSVSNLGNPDLVILPGSKTTIPDLVWMKQQGLTAAILALHHKGTSIIGICGGYQMLGDKIYDPEGVESSLHEIDGLGLLPLTTIFAGTKETHRIKGEVAEASGLLSGAKGAPITGYEIHMGRTTGEGVGIPFRIHDRSDVPVTAGTAFDGAMDASGRVLGAYIHGLFHNGELRRAVLQELARRKGVSLPLSSQELVIDQEYDKLADWVRASLKMELIYQMTGLSQEYQGVNSYPFGG